MFYETGIPAPRNTKPNTLLANGVVAWDGEISIQAEDVSSDWKEVHTQLKSSLGKHRRNLVALSKSIVASAQNMIEEIEKCGICNKSLYVRWAPFRMP